MVWTVFLNNVECTEMEMNRGSSVLANQFSTLTTAGSFWSFRVQPTKFF